MRILITGSEGNIGKPLCSYLKKDHDVMRIDILPGYAKDYMMCNINNSLELNLVFKDFNPDVVFHLAAIYGRLANEKYAYASTETNIVGTNNIIQLCKEYNSKLIHFSTSEVYGNIGGILHEDRDDLSPNNRYGILKLETEKLIKYEVKEYNIDALILRPNMIYTETEAFGEFRSAMIRFVESLLKKEKITVYVDSSRSWIYIGDAVKIFEKCIYIKGFHIINITHPKVIPTKRFAEILCEKLNLKYEDYVIEEKSPHRMTLNKHIDVSKMIKLTGITPEISIEEGIDIIIKAVKKRINE